MDEKCWKEGDVIESHDYKYKYVAEEGEPAYLFERKIGTAKIIRKRNGITGERGIYLYKGTIYAGCQRIPALSIFRKLGKALGYEVE